MLEKKYGFETLDKIYRKIVEQYIDAGECYRISLTKFIVIGDNITVRKVFSIFQSISCIYNSNAEGTDIMKTPLYMYFSLYKDQYILNFDYKKPTTKNFIMIYPPAPSMMYTTRVTLLLCFYRFGGSLANMHDAYMLDTNDKKFVINMDLNNMITGYGFFVDEENYKILRDHFKF